MLKIINSLSTEAVKFIARTPRTAFSSKPSYLHNPGKDPLRFVTVGTVLEESANRWPGRLAFTSIHQGTNATFEDLLLQSDALAFSLNQYGLKKGDRFGIWAPNCGEWLVAMYAAARAGLIPVGLNPIYEKPEASFCLKKVGVKALLIGEDIKTHKYYDIIKELIPELSTSVPGELKSSAFPDLKLVIHTRDQKLPGTISTKVLIKENMKRAINTIPAFQSQISPDDAYLIHFTSGTTGDPKAALSSHFSSVNCSFYMGRRIGVEGRHDKICVQVPVFHAFGTLITALVGLIHGATLVLPSAMYNSHANADAVYSEGCTVIHGTPTMFVDACEVIGSRPSPPTTLHTSLTAGSPCSPQLIIKKKQILRVDNVKSLYGMTETNGGVFQSIDGDDMEKATQTVGYIHDHLEVKVVDSSDNAVPFGLPGELLVRGYSTMLGYWGDLEKTLKTIGPDKWLRTGDQMAISEDGYGKIIGRIKDLIIRGGENIYPKEIEDLLNSHPDIIESQVFGVADERLVEEICVAIRVQDGKSINLKNIREFCSGKINHQKVPRILKIVHAYPKTVSGKIQKYRLKEMVENGTI